MAKTELPDSEVVGKRIRETAPGTRLPIPSSNRHKVLGAASGRSRPTMV